MWKCDNLYTKRDSLVAYFEQFNLNSETIPKLIKEHSNLVVDEEEEQNTGIKF